MVDQLTEAAEPQGNTDKFRTVMDQFFIRMPTDLVNALENIAYDEALAESERPNVSKTIRSILLREVVRRGYLKRPQLRKSAATSQRNQSRRAKKKVAVKK